MAKELLKRIQSEIKASIIKTLMLIKITNTLKYLDRLSFALIICM